MSQTVSNTTIPAMAPPPVVRQWTRMRVAGHIIVALWFLLFAGLAIYLYNAWRIDLFETYGPRYWSGLLITLKLVAVSIVIGALLSLPITAARMSNNRWLRGIAFGYVYFFRGTPLLAQTFLIYYGFGTFRPFLESIGLWVFSAMRGTAPFWRFRSTRQPIRLKSCAALSRAWLRANGKVLRHLVFPSA